MIETLSLNKMMTETFRKSQKNESSSFVHELHCDAHTNQIYLKAPKIYTRVERDSPTENSG